MYVCIHKVLKTYSIKAKRSLGISDLHVQSPSLVHTIQPNEDVIQLSVHKVSQPATPPMIMSQHQFSQFPIDQVMILL